MLSGSKEYSNSWLKVAFNWVAISGGCEVITFTKLNVINVEIGHKATDYLLSQYGNEET